MRVCAAQRRLPGTCTHPVPFDRCAFIRSPLQPGQCRLWHQESRCEEASDSALMPRVRSLEQKADPLTKSPPGSGGPLGEARMRAEGQRPESWGFPGGAARRTEPPTSCRAASRRPNPAPRRTVRAGGQAGAARRTGRPAVSSGFVQDGRVREPRGLSLPPAWPPGGLLPAWHSWLGPRAAGWDKRGEEEKEGGGFRQWWGAAWGAGFQAKE